MVNASCAASPRLLRWSICWLLAEREVALAQRDSLIASSVGRVAEKARISNLTVGPRTFPEHDLDDRVNVLSLSGRGLLIVSGLHENPLAILQSNTESPAGPRPARDRPHYLPRRRTSQARI